MIIYIFTQMQCMKITNEEGNKVRFLEHNMDIWLGIY